MADHPRSSEQQEADAAASKGCGMFDFLKKKPEDVPSSEHKEEEKPSLAEKLHLSHSSSSSDGEAGEIGEKKKKMKEKVWCHNKGDAADECETDGKKGIMEKLPAAKDHEQAKKPEQEDGKEKGFMEKMKEKLPGGHHEKPEPGTNHENSKEKGFMEKIKEKLPGHTKQHEDGDDEKKKET